MEQNKIDKMIITEWIRLFPEKKLNRGLLNQLSYNIENCWKDEWFKKNWKKALLRASQSDYCHNGSFFNLLWFTRNLVNSKKCLAGNYDNDRDRNLVPEKKDYYNDPYADYLLEYDETEWDEWNTAFDKIIAVND